MEESTGPTGPTEGSTGPDEEITRPTGPGEPVPLPVEETGPTGPTYIITLDELKTSQQALVRQETVDRIAVSKCMSPDAEELKRRLLQWVSLGLPDGFQIMSTTVTPPQKCSDGVTRPKFEYIEFLLGTTLESKLIALQEKLPGMLLSYSIPDSQLCLHVSKG